MTDVRGRLVRAVLLTTGLVLAVASPALAGDPIMPLGSVQKGMDCTGYSVVQGTEVVPFDVEIIDVITGDAGADAPRILFSASGAAVDRTGLGPGFSGSPIYCPGSDGIARVAGAVSESIGEYGNSVALATPIELILGEPVDAPAGARYAPRTMRQAQRISAPLSLSGLSPRVARAFTRAAAKAKRAMYVAPSRPRQAVFPTQALRPGSAMAVGLASGDITAGAVGTVAYVDGDRVWSFGHSLDGAGRRSLFLQDAYVFTVVNNPVGVEGIGTYKLAAPGHDVGLLSSDGMNAVVGRTGVLPQRFPLKVIAKDVDTGKQRILNMQIADENVIDLPTGTSSLALVGSGAVAQGATSALGGAPTRQTGEMCARIEIANVKKPLRFCNRYLTRASGSDGEGALGAVVPMVGDFLDAVMRIDEFNFARLSITNVEVNLKIRRGLRQAFMLRARAPQVVRRGRTVRVRVRAQRVRGAAFWRTMKVRVPRGLSRGEHLLTLSGTPSDDGGVLEVDLAQLLFGTGDEGSESEAGPRTISALARSVARIHRYDGVRATFVSPDDEVDEFGESGASGRRTYRDPELRLSGELQIPVEVR